MQQKIRQCFSPFLITSMFVVAGMLISTTTLVAQERYIFFGDSLSDNQNSFQLTDRAFGSAFATPQVPPYSNGRFSNGPNWTDDIADSQLFYWQYYLSSAECLTENVLVSGSGACDATLDPGAQPEVSMNFSFGGSKSGTEVLLNAPGFLTVLEDLEAYNAAGTISDVSGSVFTVWTGGNDYSAYASASGGLTQQQAVTQVLDNIDDGLVRISNLGAKRIVAFNIQPLETIPTFLSVLGTAGATTAGEVADLHNNQFNARLEAVSAQTGTEIILVDVHSMYEHINSNPLLYGFSNITSGCIDETTLARNADCLSTSDESGFLYWDGTHPTTAAHGFVAELFNATLQAVDTAPDNFAAVPDSSLEVSKLFTENVGTQLTKWRMGTLKNSAGVEVKKSDFAFVSASTSNGSRSSDSGFTGYDFNAQSAILGFGRMPSDWNQKVVFGGHLGMLQMDVETPGSNTSGTTFDNSSFGAGGFVGFREDNLSMTAQVSGIYLDVQNIRRRTGFSVLPTANSDTQGVAFAGKFDAQLNFPTKIGTQSVWIAPRGFIKASTADLKGFSENDAEFLNLSVQNTSASESALGLGLNLWTKYKLDDEAEATPFISFSGESTVSRSGGSVEGTLSSGQTVSSTGNQSKHTSFVIHGGVDLSLTSSTSLGVSSTAKFADTSGEENLTFQALLKHSF